MAIQKITAKIIADGAIIATDIADGSITTAKIADANVTAAKLATGAALPSQSGNTNYYLTTDGTNSVWKAQTALAVANTQLTGSIEATQVGTTVSQLFGMRNRIINGDMRIDQRRAGSSVTPTADSTYTLDRWKARLTQASKFSVQQDAGAVTPPAGFNDYLGVTSTSAYTVGSTDYFGVQQDIEGFNTADLGFGTASVSTITISFWVRSSLTGTFGGFLSNSASDRFYVFSYTISSANTWERKTVTITGDTTGTWLTTNGIGLQVFFSLGAGSTFSGSAGSWSSSVLLAPTGATSVVGTNGATWYVTGVQLEVGSTATPFERRLYGQELVLCQRYFEISGATGATGNPNYHGTLYDPTSTLYLGQVQFQVTKRTAPTVAVGAGSTGAASVIGISSFFFTRNAAAAYLTYWTASSEF